MGVVPEVHADEALHPIIECIYGNAGPLKGAGFVFAVFLSLPHLGEKARPGGYEGKGAWKMKGEYKKYRHLWQKLTQRDMVFVYWITVRSAVTGQIIDRLEKHAAEDKYGDEMYQKGRKKSDMEWTVWIYR